MFIKRVFTREISSRNEIIPVYGEMSLRVRLHVTETKSYPGMKSSPSMVKCLLLFTRFCRDEISSQDEKKKKKLVNTSSQDEILK